MNLLEHTAPFDWSQIQADVAETGGVIVKQLFSPDQVDRFTKESDAWLSTHRGAGLPQSGSDVYDRFLGQGTLRLQGLLEKLACAPEWIARPELVSWVRNTMQPISTSVLLNAAELIQIGPGEPRQYLHRDSDSWPIAAVGDTPIVMNALIALDPFTEQNGATHVVPFSWQWDKDRRAMPEEFTRAVMAPGDALLFRGDILHGGGANESGEPRRGLSITYCAGWLRPVENSFLNLSRATVLSLPPELLDLTGFSMYDGSEHNGGLLGLHENTDPRNLLQQSLPEGG